MTSESRPSRDIDWLSTILPRIQWTPTIPTASTNSTAAATAAVGLRAMAPHPLPAVTSGYVRDGQTLLTGKPPYKGSGAADPRAKNHSAIRRDSTKKAAAPLTARTETCATPDDYCAVKEPVVPWCDKGIRESREPRITLRVGKLTIGDGS
ncbi:hypothetical protein GCM10010446_08830 [Streptomyces enissocaesilis]|uniref:Uncharacterized protein n=1 Tax=Streptomyces enissocaesilis TaxID=332589 RepID=A0ABP6JBB1_9ACTN